MQLYLFTKKIEALAMQDSANLTEIQSLIMSYYENIGLIQFNTRNSYIVRASSNNGDEIFENIKRCSYNPFTKDIPLQRCNYPRQQVFYCSIYSDTDNASTSMTCLMETAKENIDKDVKRKYFTLSRWEVTRPLNLFNTAFF